MTYHRYAILVACVVFYINVAFRLWPWSVIAQVVVTFPPFVDAICRWHHARKFRAEWPCAKIVVRR